MIGLDMPSYLPSMQFLKDRALREKLYKAFLQRASEGSFDNTENVKKVSHPPTHPPSHPHG